MVKAAKTEAATPKAIVRASVEAEPVAVGPGGSVAGLALGMSRGSMAPEPDHRRNMAWCVPKDGVCL